MGSKSISIEKGVFSITSLTSFAVLGPSSLLSSFLSTRALGVNYCAPLSSGLLISITISSRSFCGSGAASIGIIFTALFSSLPSKENEFVLLSLALDDLPLYSKGAGVLALTALIGPLSSILGVEWQLDEYKLNCSACSSLSC